jgi:hypothetical protein
MVNTTLLAACAPQSPAAPSSKNDGNPESLKALLVNLHQTVHTKKDPAAAATQLQALVPDEARLKRAFKDDVAPAVLGRTLDMYKQMGPVTVADALKLAGPGQSEVRVHGATTEEIAQYREGTVAFKEFPGGARRVAEQALRPGMTFYSVELVEPGKGEGMRYHLLYWDGKQWSMLGPVWRALESR